MAPIRRSGTCGPSRTPLEGPRGHQPAPMPLPHAERVRTRGPVGSPTRSPACWAGCGAPLRAGCPPPCTDSPPPGGPPATSNAPSPTPWPAAGGNSPDSSSSQRPTWPPCCAPWTPKIGPVPSMSTSPRSKRPSGATSDSSCSAGPARTAPRPATSRPRCAGLSPVPAVEPQVRDQMPDSPHAAVAACRHSRTVKWRCFQRRPIEVVHAFMTAGVDACQKAIKTAGTPACSPACTHTPSESRRNRLSCKVAGKQADLPKPTARDKRVVDSCRCSDDSCWAPCRTVSRQVRQS